MAGTVTLGVALAVVLIGRSGQGPGEVAPGAVTEMSEMVSGDGPGDAAGEARAGAALPVVDNPASLRTDYGESVDALVAGFPVVLVGTVTGTESKEIPESGGTSEVYTLATVRVDRWISRAPTGAEQELVVVQHGGVWRERVLLTYGGDAIMQQGEQYLFFLRAPDGAMGFAGGAYARFPLRGGSLDVVKEEFGELGAVKALRGLAPDEAAAQIRAALARNGLPAAE